MNDTTRNPIAEFERLGNKASYHFADDSTGEWDLAYKAKRQALELFDANPDLQDQMRETAKGFLWPLNHDRPVSSKGSNQ